MRVALGISENVPLVEQDIYARTAAQMGYEAIWTNEGAVRDAFVACTRWATVAPGLGVGVAVAPALLRTPMALAMAAGTLAEMTGGRFTLGLGAASPLEYAHQFGFPEHRPVPLLRDYVHAVRALLSGAPVDYQGTTLIVRGAELSIAPTPPSVPILLGVTSPRTLRLSGEIADGVILNWCSDAQAASYRAQVEEGARLAGRDPRRLIIAAYVRICVDDDIAVARGALARAALPYALGLPGYGAAYRAHFERMGFAEQLVRASAMLDAGEPLEQVADALPSEMLSSCAYFGPPAGALEALRALTRHLDLAIVRIVPARRGADSTLAGIRAGAALFGG